MTSTTTKITLHTRESIGNLVKLQYLFLKGNSIQTVPSEIGQSPP